MAQLTANDLKTRGVTAIEVLLVDQPEVMISVRGKERYVVMDVARYHYMRECELDSALAQSQADIAAGRFVVQSAREHVTQLDAMLIVDSSAAAAKALARKPFSVPPSRSKASKALSIKAPRRRPGV